MDKDFWFGIFIGGIIGMALFGTLEYMWGIGGLAPTFYIIALPMIMVFVDKFTEGKKDE